MSRYEEFQGAPIGTPVTGGPTPLREAKITVVNSDGTVSAKALNGRKGWEILPVPKWYAPQTGDIVLVGQIDGLRQRPVVLSVLTTKTGGTPITSHGASGEVTLAKLTEGGKTGKLTITNGLVTSITQPT